ncbi:syncytin-2-like [Pleurodeles waltl]|uniref:syncytin-2-like n=1 Tax=Pleurodeles waltl TaxID=8319 RepID=UPI0037097053
MAYNRGSNKKSKVCGWLSLIIGIVCTIIIVGVIVGMPWLDKKNINATSKLETATLTPWERFEQDARHLHEGTNSKGELSTNVFYCLLNEYVETMDAKDCYVCTKIPSSVQEGVTYHSLPLTYGISCSLLLTRFYNQEHVQYFYSNLDVVFSFVPVIEFLNKLAKEHDIKIVRGFFEPTLTFGTAYAHRNNLTCLLSPVEKSFLDHTDDRRKALKERLEKGLEKRSYANDYAYTAIKTQGKLAIDALHVGRLCIYRPKSEQDNLFVGTSECRHLFLFQSKWTFMLNGQDPAIPGIYYICGLNAYYRLPKGWYGTCYLGIVFPKIYQIDDLKQIPKTSELQHTRQKRESVAAVIGDIFGAIIHSVGVILNSMKIQKLSTIVDNMLTNFTGAILLIDTELAAERAMTLQNQLALDILLAKSGGVCKMLNERHCCTFIPDNNIKIRSMLTNLTRDSTDLKDLKELGV